MSKIVFSACLLSKKRAGITPCGSHNLLTGDKLLLLDDADSCANFLTPHQIVNLKHMLSVFSSSIITIGKNWQKCMVTYKYFFIIQTYVCSISSYNPMCKVSMSKTCIESLNYSLRYFFPVPKEKQLLLPHFLLAQNSQKFVIKTAH